MNWTCDPIKKNLPTKNDKHNTEILELFPGIHKVTIPAPAEGRKMKEPGGSYYLHAAVRWSCFYPVSISGSDPAKTINLLESESNAVQKTGFEDLRDSDARVLVPIYIFSTRLVSFESVTFRSAIP